MKRKSLRQGNQTKKTKHWQHVLQLRKQTKISRQRVDQRTQNQYKNPKTRRENEKIFVRLASGQGEKAPKIRFVCQEKVLKKMKHLDMYKVRFLPQFEKEPKMSRFSIEDIADFDLGEKRKRNDFNNEENEFKKMNHIRLLLLPTTIDDRMHLLTKQGYSMIFNLSKERNC